MGSSALWTSQCAVVRSATARFLICCLGIHLGVSPTDLSLREKPESSVMVSVAAGNRINSFAFPAQLSLKVDWTNYHNVMT